MFNSMKMAIVSAPADAEIFLTRSAVAELGAGLELVEVYGYEYFSDRLGRTINVLDTPGAPAVIVLPAKSIKWGHRDSDGIAWTSEDCIEMDLLGGEAFISFRGESDDLCECITEDGEEVCCGECGL